MLRDVMPPRMQHSDRQHCERKYRQKVNRAPRPPEAELVNPEPADADNKHQPHPSPADRAVRKRALALNCTTPRMTAAIAANACSLIAGLAERSGARVTDRPVALDLPPEGGGRRS